METFKQMLLVVQSRFRNFRWRKKSIFCPWSRQKGGRVAYGVGPNGVAAHARKTSSSELRRSYFPPKTCPFRLRRRKMRFVEKKKMFQTASLIFFPPVSLSPPFRTVNSVDRNRTCILTARRMGRQMHARAGPRIGGNDNKKITVPQ